MNNSSFHFKTKQNTIHNKLIQRKKEIIQIKAHYKNYFYK